MASIEPYETKAGKRWCVRFRTPDGKQSMKRGFKRKIDAQTWAAQTHVDMRHGMYVPPADARTKVSEIWERWIDIKRVEDKPSTVDGFIKKWNFEIRERWGGWSVGDITPADVQEWIVDMSLGRKGYRPKAPGTTQNYVTVLSMLLETARKEHLIATNPCNDVTKPKGSVRKHHYLTAEELVRLADHMGWRHDIILILGLTGLRWSELVGLNVGDIDLQHRRINVSRAIVQVGRVWREGTPKNGKSRTVIYPAALDDIMTNAVGERGKNEILFERPNGGRLTRISKGPQGRTPLEVGLRRAGITGQDGFTVHDLRHTAASLMVSSGANVKAVQRQLGHATASMTLDTYADLFDSDLDALGAGMNNLLLEHNVLKMCSKRPSSAA